MNADIGQFILEELTSCSLFTVEVHDQGNLFIWSSGAAEQLEAIFHRALAIYEQRSTDTVSGENT